MTWEEAKQRFLSHEAYVGRKFDLMGVHYAAPVGGCYWDAPLSRGSEAWIVEHGAIPYVSWAPGFSLEEIGAGLADACLREVAGRFVTFGQRYPGKMLFLRMYWEFNGIGWSIWSGVGQAFVDAWRHTVDVFRQTGVSNAMFVWCPSEPQDGEGSSYPGDAYVDWVCSDGYNHNRGDVFSSPFHAGYSDFWEIFDDGATRVGDPSLSVHDAYGTRKPFMVGETGSNEGAPGSKGQWFVHAKDDIPARFPRLRALVYFDVDLSDVEGNNWMLDTSESSLDGFRTLAQDAYFRTRG